jgi:hypothetical protein
MQQKMPILRSAPIVEPECIDYSSDMRNCNLGSKLRLPFIPIIRATCATASAAMIWFRRVNFTNVKCVRSLLDATPRGKWPGQVSKEE